MDLYRSEEAKILATKHHLIDGLGVAVLLDPPHPTITTSDPSGVFLRGVVSL